MFLDRSLLLVHARRTDPRLHGGSKGERKPRALEMIVPGKWEKRGDLIRNKLMAEELKNATYEVYLLLVPATLLFNSRN